LIALQSKYFSEFHQRETGFIGWMDARLVDDYVHGIMDGAVRCEYYTILIPLKNIPSQTAGSFASGESIAYKESRNIVTQILHHEMKSIDFSRQRQKQ